MHCGKRRGEFRSAESGLSFAGGSILRLSVVGGMTRKILYVCSTFLLWPSHARRCGAAFSHLGLAHEAGIWRIFEAF